MNKYQHDKMHGGNGQHRLEQVIWGLGNWAVVWDSGLVFKGSVCCVLCPGVIDWHNYGTVMGVLECGTGLFWIVEPYSIH